MRCPQDKSLDVEQATAIQQYLISASLVICGIMSAVQVTGIRLPFNRQWGAGILSVMGVSFTTFSIAGEAAPPGLCCACPTGSAALQAAPHLVRRLTLFHCASCHRWYHQAAGRQRRHLF